MIWAQVPIVACLLVMLGLRSRMLALLLALLILIPLRESVSLAMALRGLWGDPSITTLQLLALTLTGKVPQSLRSGYRAPAVIALSGLALYASALGPWNLDLYRFGYQPALLGGILAAVALAAWWRGQAWWLWLLTIDLFAWRAGCLESSNLWDTLLDPLLMLAMLALALRNGYRASRNRKLILPS